MNGWVIALLSFFVVFAAAIVTWAGIVYKNRDIRSKRDQVVSDTLLQHTKSIEKLESQTRAYDNFFKALDVRMAEFGFIQEDVKGVKEDLKYVKTDIKEINKLMHEIHIEVIKVSK